MTLSLDQMEVMATALEESGDYRIIRRLKPRQVINEPDGSSLQTGIVIDFETTGLSPVQDEIIEIGMVPFTYNAEGKVFAIGEPFSRLRQPSQPIDPAITSITGITNEMVAGKLIDPNEVAEFIALADLVIAHHADFDRKFAERFCPSFAQKPWACSMAQIDWSAAGFNGKSLGVLLNGYGFFHDAHRAVDDCLAVVEILARRVPHSEQSGLGHLLNNALTDRCLIQAVNSPFDKKDILKARGYRWNGAGDAKSRAWSIELREDGLEAELTFLRTEIYGYAANIPVKRTTPYDRFSDRE